MTKIAARLSNALADCYKIERELGSGGMAVGYLAEDLKHDRKVAAKVLRSEPAAGLGTDSTSRGTGIASSRKPAC